MFLPMSLDKRAIRSFEWLWNWHRSTLITGRGLFLGNAGDATEFGQVVVLQPNRFPILESPAGDDERRRFFAR
jgi:hypothetical protein